MISSSNSNAVRTGLLAIGLLLSSICVQAGEYKMSLSQPSNILFQNTQEDIRIPGDQEFFNLGFFMCPFQQLQNHLCLIWHDRDSLFRLAHSAYEASLDQDLLRQFVLLNPMKPQPSNDIVQVTGEPYDDSIIISYVIGDNWLLQKVTLTKNSENELAWAISKPTRVKLDADVRFRLTPSLSIKDNVLTASYTYYQGDGNKSFSQFIDIKDLSAIGVADEVTPVNYGKPEPAFPWMKVASFDPPVKTSTGLASYGAFHPASSAFDKTYGMLLRQNLTMKFEDMVPAPQFNSSYYFDLNHFKLPNNMTVISLMTDHSKYDSDSSTVQSTLYPDVLDGSAGWSKPVELKSNHRFLQSLRENIIESDSEGSCSAIPQVVLELESYEYKRPFIRLLRMCN